MSNTIDSDIQSAFMTQLETLSGLPPVADENVNFSPEVGTTYFSVCMLRVPDVQAELGDTGMNMKKGIFQISVRVPSNQGRGPALTLAGSVISLFKRGTVLAYGSVADLKIVSASLGPGMVTEHWWQIPVSVRWYALTANN